MIEEIEGIEGFEEFEEFEVPIAIGIEVFHEFQFEP